MLKPNEFGSQWNNKLANLMNPCKILSKYSMLICVACSNGHPVVMIASTTGKEN